MRAASGAHLRKNARRKYAAVLKSASRLFLKHGYTHTSMDAVAQAAGVSKQTVYSYFTNKELLFRCMIEELCNAHTPPESLLADPSLPPREALLKIAQGFMDTIASQVGLGVHRLVMAEAPRHPRVAELFFLSGPQKMHQLLAHYLRRQMMVGTLHIDNIDTACGHFFSMLKSWYQMRMILRLKPAPTKAELRNHVRDTVDAFCRAYNI